MDRRAGIRSRVGRTSVWPMTLEPTSCMRWVATPRVAVSLTRPTLVNELSVASWPAGSWVASPPNLILPNRQANQAGFYGSGQIWSVGGIVGQTFQFLAEVQRRSNGSGPCGTPTATPTASPSATATPTAPATATPTAPATATPTASPTCTPAQITTLFASNNNGNPGGANYFDLTVAANPITVTALDINTACYGGV